MANELRFTTPFVAIIVDKPKMIDWNVIFSVTNR